MTEPAGFDDLLECALWSSLVSHDDDRCPAHHADDHFEPDDLAPAIRAELLGDYTDFVTANAELIEQSGLDMGQVGHDFWLTREGHGAGFWDRGLGDVGEALTRAAKVYGGFELELWLDGPCDED